MILDDELSNIINNWLNGDEVESEGSDWSSSKETNSNSTEKESDTYSNLDDAFSDLMS